MDDFTWGATRQVDNADAVPANTATADELDDVDVDESNDGVDEEVGAEQHHLAPRSGTHQLSTMAAPARWEFGAGNRQVRVGQDDRRFRSSYVNSSLSHVNEAQLDKELRSLDEE
jgi:hypothetical protein